MTSDILFLDFDGVLHPGTSATVRHAPLLATWLAQHPGVSVVVSSTWREQQSLQELREWFPRSMQARLIDVTPVLPQTAGVRQREIESWLRTHPVRRWAALDDEARLFTRGCPWLVLTESKTGLTAAHLQQLSEWFTG